MSKQEITPAKILTHFSTCNDPRTRPVRYPLMEIILLVVLSTLCGEEGWEAFEEWGKDKLSFLRTFLPFKNGVPCPDTIRRVMERLKSEEFLNAFISWATDLNERVSGQLCIDGKALRGASKKKSSLHIVTVWSEANRIVLGSVTVPSKSNEIPATEELLNLLVLKEGDVVTMDAMGCQKSIVGAIRKQKADYLIALKKNQQNFSGEVENYFNQVLEAPEYASCSDYIAEKQGHGRQDRQEVWVSKDVEWLPQKEDWKGLQSLILVCRYWEEKGEKRSEKRYYISILKERIPEDFAKIIRRHWSIENELHWHLDVTFNEDASQIGAAANENLRVARMIALDMLRGEKSNKRGLKAKARRCHRSDDYLKKVLLVANF
ncbi:MAG: putative transposase YbfD/YdcC [Chlamydiales bacterium]|jgi:predicted transposase YbfD/YdcC